MLSFRTIIAFGDAFSAQCGTQTNTKTKALDINLNSWTDFGSGLRGNPIFTDCAFNSGLNYLNYLTNCTKDGLDPLTCPISLIDLASAGVRLGNQSVPTEEGRVSITSQVSNWRTYVKPELSFETNETLVSLFYGWSDLNLVTSRVVDDDPTYQTEVDILERIEVIEQSMNTLYDDGLRHFLVFKLPATTAKVSSLTDDWNRILDRRISTVHLDKSGAKVYWMDTNSVYNDFLAMPERYNFTYTTEWCSTARSKHSTVDCSDSSEYLLMDDTHWTPKAHMHLASAIQEMMNEKMTLSSIDDQADINSTLSALSGSVKQTYSQIKATAYEHPVVALIFTLLLPLFAVFTFLMLYMHRRRGASILRFLNFRRRGRIYAQVPVHERVTDNVELQETTSRRQGQASRQSVAGEHADTIPRDDFDI